ncbi:hypothetical protein AHAS_Ahas07G0130000 [Arachis hypogaea]
MLLCGTTLFSDKFKVTMNSKFCRYFSSFLRLRTIVGVQHALYICIVHYLGHQCMIART